VRGQGRGEAGKVRDAAKAHVATRATSRARSQHGGICVWLGFESHGVSQPVAALRTPPRQLPAGQRTCHSCVPSALARSRSTESTAAVPALGSWRHVSSTSTSHAGLRRPPAEGAPDIGMGGSGVW